MDTCIVCISKFISDKNKGNLYEILNSVKDKMHVFHCSMTGNEKYELNNAFNKIFYNPKKIKNATNNFYQFEVLKKFYQSISTYKYYYLINEDVNYPGNYWYLFETLNNTSDADFLSSFIKKFQVNDKKHVDGKNDYNFSEIKKDKNVKQLLDSYMPFIRITGKALEFLCNHNKTDLSRISPNLYVATLLYNYGYKIQSLSSHPVYDDVEFKFQEITCSRYFLTKKEKKERKKKEKLIFRSNVAPINNLNKFDFKINKVFESCVDNPKFSVVLYLNVNVKKSIKVIKSILDQDIDFEYEIILVLDRPDKNLDCYIKKLNNSNITYFYTDASNLENSWNIGFKEAKGKYVVFSDCGAKFYKNTLKKINKFTMSKKNSDVFITQFNDNKKNHVKSKFINLEDMLDKVDLMFGLVTCKKSLYNKINFAFEPYFAGFSREKFLINCARYNFRIYRSKICSVKADASYIKKCKNNKLYLLNKKRVLTAYKFRNKKQCGDLTIIMPFKNEKEEVEKTIFSIRSTAKNVRILLIDDASDDNFNYKDVANFWNCDYIRNKKTLSTAACRDLGVNQIKTKYFIHIDSHMRFYQNNWNLHLLKKLQKYKKAIIYGSSIIIKSKDRVYINEDCKSKSDALGCYISFDEYNFPSSFWQGCIKISKKNKTVLNTPALMGACYASNVKFWKSIEGYYGLYSWGDEEALISLKTWLLGGKIILDRNFLVGHIYRTGNTPFKFLNTEKHWCNCIFLIYLFTASKKKADKYYNKIIKLIGKKQYKSNKKLIYKQKEKGIKAQKRLFGHSLKKRMEKFIDFDTEISQYKLNNLHTKNKFIKVYKNPNKKNIQIYI